MPGYRLSPGHRVSSGVPSVLDRKKKEEVRNSGKHNQNTLESMPEDALDLVKLGITREEWMTRCKFSEDATQRPVQYPTRNQ
jgi:hypothetical protein